MTEANHLKLKLVELLDKKEFSKVIQLYGKWGTGKTHLWRSTISTLPELIQKKVINISLFDKNSVSELKEEILLQVYSYNNTLSKYGKHLDTLQNVVTKSLTGVTVSSLSSLLKAKDFKDVIISFDDIERRNKNFDFDTFLGFVSLLKDEKQCTVILILNYDKFVRDDKEIFNRYKEKIIDYNLILHRNPLEALELALSGREIDFKDILQEVVQDIGIDNIRMIKHMIKMIEETKEINFDKYNTHVVVSFIKAYLYYSYVYYNYGVNDINSILEYEAEKVFQDKFIGDEVEEEPFLQNKNYEDILDTIEISTNFGSLNKKLLLIFDDVMKSHFISNGNVEKLKEELEEMTINKDLYLSVQKIRQLQKNYFSDMTNSIVYYYNDITTEIKQNKEGIVQHMGLTDFFSLMDTLKIKPDAGSEITLLEEDCIEFFIQWLSQLDEKHYDNLEDFYGTSCFDILKHRNKSYYARFEALKGDAIEGINCEFINEQLKKIRSQANLLDGEIKIMNLIPIVSIVNCIKESPGNMVIIYKFIHTKSQVKLLNQFTKNVWLSFKEIYSNGDQELKAKIERVFSKEEFKIIQQVKIDA